MKPKKINLAKTFEEFNKFLCTVPRILTTMVHSDEEVDRLIDLVADDEDDLEWVKEYDFILLCSIWLDTKTLEKLGYLAENEEDSCITVVCNNYDRVIFYQFFRMSFYEDMSISRLKTEINKFIKQEDYEMCSMLDKILKKKEKQLNKLNNKKQ